MLQLLNELGLMVRPHIYQIATMIVATLLVIYGNELNQLIRRQIAGLHFLLRAIIFVLVCAFGYGYLLVGFTPILSSWLHQIPLHLIAPATLVIVMVLGLLAERKKQL
ncbi:DUF3392 domain-containing protein [Idiomarina sp. OT37-5b]|uniref:DUF3392 domain-containing protein n=1 Tax=Idiomarina aquatica TaxID=1327752 RepID=A0AA94EFQ1_9GAMM|nr:MULTISPECIES: DUF3392 family protein [Idiomarina]AVJ56123.1 DUF3392 domain-containing protein [Idiomarina sp. OT37-5b]RUO43353.1 DUF3392 domain-containing protein [Idiomarina aquatica]